MSHAGTFFAQPNFSELQQYYNELLAAAVDADTPTAGAGSEEVPSTGTLITATTGLIEILIPAEDESPRYPDVEAAIFELRNDEIFQLALQDKGFHTLFQKILTQLARHPADFASPLRMDLEQLLLLRLQEDTPVGVASPAHSAAAAESSAPAPVATNEPILLGRNRKVAEARGGAPVRRRSTSDLLALELEAVAVNPKSPDAPAMFSPRTKAKLSPAEGVSIPRGLPAEVVAVGFQAGWSKHVALEQFIKRLIKIHATGIKVRDKTPEALHDITQSLHAVGADLDAAFSDFSLLLEDITRYTEELIGQLSSAFDKIAEEDAAYVDSYLSQVLSEVASNVQIDFFKVAYQMYQKQVEKNILAYFDQKLSYGRLMVNLEARFNEFKDYIKGFTAGAEVLLGMNAAKKALLNSFTDQLLEHFNMSYDWYIRSMLAHAHDNQPQINNLLDSLRGVQRDFREVREMHTAELNFAEKILKSLNDADQDPAIKVIKLREFKDKIDAKIRDLMIASGTGTHKNSHVGEMVRLNRLRYLVEKFTVQYEPAVEHAAPFIAADGLAGPPAEWGAPVIDDPFAETPRSLAGTATVSATFAAATMASAEATVSAGAGNESNPRTASAFAPASAATEEKTAFNPAAGY